MKRPTDNRGELLTTNVAGFVAPARLHGPSLSYDEDGRLSILPGTGGMSLGVHSGDPVGRHLADHLMVGVSVEDDPRNPAIPGAVHLLSCLGNTVRDSQGVRLGVVVGKRGGIAPGFLPPCLVSVEVPSLPSHLLSGDRVVVEAIGRGLYLPDWPAARLSNTSPLLLDALPIAERGTFLEIPVRARVPSHAAGPGLGSDPWVGDLEVAAPEEVEGEVGDLCFGDLVAFDAIDSRVTRFFRPGFVSVGVVAHGPSPAPGHGIGVTVLLSGPAEQIRTPVKASASMGHKLAEWAASL
jgi:hypothetical protein